jgi:hypothetical protein
MEFRISSRRTPVFGSMINRLSPVNGPAISSHPEEVAGNLYI